MRVYSAILLIVGYCSLGEAFSKYGRTCKDIGCLGNEMCVMENDPCSYYQRNNECGSYPTCKKVGDNAKTCSNFVCPPGNVCKMVGSNPKCVDNPIQKGHVGYDTSSLDNPGGNNAPSAPVAPSGGNLYPAVPRGETTPRPNVRPQATGGGYQGGQIGSGYPGQPSGYPSQGGGYPQQNYPGYPGYQGGYQQPGNYPQGGYPQGGYQQQYPGYQGYPGYQQPNQQQYPNHNNQNRYGQKNSGTSFSDQLSNTLKNLGTDLFKNALGKIVSGAISGKN